MRCKFYIHVGMLFILQIWYLDNSLSTTFDYLNQDDHVWLCLENSKFK